MRHRVIWVALLLTCLFSLSTLAIAQATASPATPAKLTPSEILKLYQDAVPLIVTSLKSGSDALGSGFFIEDGTVLVTNFHVIEGAESAFVRLADKRVLEVESVLAYDRDIDLAVLKIEEASTRSVTLGDSEAMSIGDPIVVIGNPQGLERTISDGLISGVRKEDINEKIFNLYQISAPVSGGSSGGPVFNQRGEVIGVVVSGLRDGQNLNFAIPVKEVKQLLAKREPIRLSKLPDSKKATVALSLEGSWKAALLVNGESRSFGMTLSRASDTLFGTYHDEKGPMGNLMGQISGSSLELEMTNTGANCDLRYVALIPITEGVMAGKLTGRDCRGGDVKGILTMERGVVNIARQITMDKALRLRRMYGEETELRGIKKVYLPPGLDPTVEGEIFKELKKYSGYTIVYNMNEADALLLFDHDEDGLYGEGQVVRYLKDEHALRVIWKFSDTRITVFDRYPFTNFAREFIKIFKKYNP